MLYTEGGKIINPLKTTASISIEIEAVCFNLKQIQYVFNLNL